MEGKIPPNHTPRALLLEAFDKLTKILPKKYTDLKSLLQQSIGNPSIQNQSNKRALEQIKTETSDQMDANPYFTIFKLVNQTKLPKMIETSLTYLQVIFKHSESSTSACACRNSSSMDTSMATARTTPRISLWKTTWWHIKLKLSDCKQAGNSLMRSLK